MSQTRIPKTAESILPFCRPWHARRSNVCFESYAEMMIFAASLGFYYGGKRPALSSKDYLLQPNPISVDVYKGSQMRLFPNLLLLALAEKKDKSVSKDDKEICNIVEDYSHLGFVRLEKLLSKSSPEEFHIDVARLIIETKIQKI